MGLFADNIETARDRWEEAGQSPFSGSEILFGPSPAEPPSPTYVCDSCGSQFSSESAYKRHVATQHANQFMYLTIDKRVAQSIEKIDDRPRSLYCVIMRSGVELRLKANSFEKTVPLSAGEHDLLQYLPISSDGIVTLKFQSKNWDREYNFIVNSKPEFRSERLEPEIEHLQRSLDTGDELNWLKYDAVGSDPSLNDIEKRYYKGFYDYTVGFSAELQENYRDAQSQLERALQLLAPFNTSMANAAKRILGLRFNRFHLLDDVTENSRFYLLKRFFVDCESILNTEQIVAEKQSVSRPVYCDGFTERLLAIVNAFYRRDTTNVIVPCEQLMSEPALTRDYNHQVKLRLVLARIAWVTGDSQRANREYAKLIDDETFGEEAKARAMQQGRFE
jgi:hypothetical protein